MISEELARAVEEAKRFEQARRYVVVDLETDFHLGGQGSVSRDELHER